MTAHASFEGLLMLKIMSDSLFDTTSTLEVLHNHHPEPTASAGSIALKT
jgi:hypothetical protein